jgi:hypothetical protein
MAFDVPLNDVPAGLNDLAVVSDEHPGMVPP